MIRALCLILVLSDAAAAQEQITPDAFLDRAGTQTLTFEDFPGGGVVGVEQFLSRTRTVWSTPEGICTYGIISIRGAYLCFAYPELQDREACWVPFDQDGRLLVLSTNLAMQQVTAVTDEPVICEDAPMS